LSKCEDYPITKDVIPFSSSLIIIVFVAMVIKQRSNVENGIG